ncbi:MAG: acyltransferase [Cytophagales bacterium]|nr:acyltransferase [Cytophagales bacterium]
MSNYDKSVFKIRACFNIIFYALRRIKWIMFGAKIESGVSIGKLIIPWPHQLSIGKNVILEDGIYFKFDGIWSPGPSIIISEGCFIGKDCEFNIKSKIFIGENTLIGSGSRFIDHDHGLSKIQPMKFQKCPTSEIVVEEDVWIGANVVVLKGVSIGKGAVIAAGAIVNKSVPQYEIWGGIPAKKIGIRDSEA